MVKLKVFTNKLLIIRAYSLLITHEPYQQKKTELCFVKKNNKFDTLKFKWFYSH